MRRREVLIGIKSQLRAWKVRVSGRDLKEWCRGGGGWILALKNFEDMRRRSASLVVFLRKTLSDANTLKYTEKNNNKGLC